jgi:hypothetical protein
VEPLFATTLLDPHCQGRRGAGVGAPNPTVVFGVVAPWYAVFITAASAAAFSMASSATFVAAALSATTFTTAALSVAAFIIAALSAATIAVVASSVAFTATASSAVLISAAFSTATTAAETSLVAEVDPLPPDVATLGSGYGAVAAPGAYCPNNGGSLTTKLPHPPLLGDIIFL